ncbi:YdcF family protein [Pseudaquabacterium pictum]|uniref:DUF218 domain-containing protein n=1 Tax=Pseudaquabacterium pictum TaxID=2315236 RepID=A0A480ALS5_9BURK|nr:YdcF family protein [Rubrivivax pictus]GCL61956.1 hypothetical protein AQPW35_10370 [Rubrivivax pictus]
MNDWLVHWGLEAWKPALRALVMPPVPMLLLVLLGLALVRRRPGLGRSLAVLGVLATWLVCTPWAGHLLQQALTRPPPPLAAAQVASLRQAPGTAILVLGAGRRTLMLEYGQPDLTPLTLERLRYGWWLARQTGLPLGYSGGVGHGARDGVTEADAVALVTVRDHGVPLRWAEGRSRDTNENARYSVAMLQAAGITRLVLVTHGFHQQRALAAFGRAIANSGRPMALVAAPVGLRPPPTPALGDFLPGHDGLAHSIWAVHEWLGWLAGA